MGDAEILQIKPGDALHSQCLKLRHEVLRVPLGRSLFTEDLSKEVDDIFLVAVVSSKTLMLENETRIQSNLEPPPSQKVVGCILLTIYPGDSSASTYKIRQMAVAQDYQGSGIGSKLVRRAEQFSTEDGKNRIYLHGRKPAVGFYLKMGYKIISEEFLELDIPHFALEKKLC